MSVIYDPWYRVIQLARLTNLAVCRFQRNSVRIKLLLNVIPDLLKSNAQLFDGPIMKEEIIKAKIRELSGSSLAKEGSENQPTRQEVKGVNTLAATSTNAITSWFCELPNTTSHYLPEYLLY